MIGPFRESYMKQKVKTSTKTSVKLFHEFIDVPKVSVPAKKV